MRIRVRVLVTFLFATSAKVCAQAPTLPTLPQKTVSLTLPTQGTSTCPTLTTGSNCIRKVPSGDATSFQNAINAATCGDTIVLAAGSIYSGNFTIPSTSCNNNSGWMVIESSALAILPASGNRVALSDASNMPVISTPNSAPAIALSVGSNHWRFIGIDITTSYVSTTNTVYNLVLSNGNSLSSLTGMPSYLTFDRCLILGLSNANVTRGILMDSSYMAIVDSYCDEIHNNGNDSQCFMSINGPGPYLIQNNFIQAAGENIMFGGGNILITNLIPSDITIIGNLFQKNVSWRGLSAPYNWVVKNHFECKTAQRVLIDGNVLQYTWAAGQDESIIIRSVNSGNAGNNTWAVCQDFTVTHNIIQHMPIGMVIVGTDVGFPPALATQRIFVSNDLFLDSSTVNWGIGHGWIFHLDPGQAPTMHDIIIDHNTSFENQAFIFVSASGSGSIANIQLTNNISDYGSYGIQGDGQSAGTNTLNTYLTSYTYNNMVFPTTSSGKTYPAGTYWATNLDGIGFTSYSGTDPYLSGNFQLTNGSAYHDAGTDGKDIGVWDWTCLNSDSTAALAGQFVPGPGGCALSGSQLLQPPSNLSVVVQ